MSNTEETLLLIVEIELRKQLKTETLREYWLKLLDGWTLPTGYTGEVPGRIWEYGPEGHLTPTGNTNATSPVWQYDQDGYLKVKE